MPTLPPQPWSLADAFETYGVRSWGAGYFGINDKGKVTGRFRADVDVRPGQTFPFAINMEKAVAFDPKTEMRIS